MLKDGKEVFRTRYDHCHVAKFPQETLPFFSRGPAKGGEVLEDVAQAVRFVLREADGTGSRIDIPT
jgi:hypothetical protein